jgi:aminoglycoside 6-adenylyltransferase
MREISPMWSGVMDTSEIWNGVAAASGFSVYENGLIVDPVIVPTSRAQLAILFIMLFKLKPNIWMQIDNPIIKFCNEMTGFFQRGTIVLFDKDGLTQKLEKIAESVPQYAPPQPSAEMFQKNADSFWVDPPRAVASLQRGRLVWAMRPFGPMFRQIHKMAEWHIRAKHGWGNEQQYRPKMIEKWADPSVVDSLSQIYPRYDVDDMWKALMASMNLYRRLTVETAALLGYDYDLTSAENVYTWVEECYKKLYK